MIQVAERQREFDNFVVTGVQLLEVLQLAKALWQRAKKIATDNENFKLR